MGLHNARCDSCDSNSDVLFPIALLVEAPYGKQMVQRWYCIKCKQAIETEADLTEDDEEEEEEEEDEGPSPKDV